MPNKQIENLVKGYEDYINRKGLDEKAVDAYFQACQAAYLSEKDIEYGLQLIKRYKQLNAQLIQKATNGGNFKKLEIWSQKNKQPVKLIDQMYELLKLESFYDFESYMLYMEKDRAFDKRFYMPRMCTLQTVARDMMKLEYNELDTYGLSLPSRVGKALSYNTPVLTRNGWKNHGDLTIRDEVIGIDGKFKKILAIHNPCMMEYEVTTSDGEVFKCHGNHEWVVYDRRKDVLDNIETKEIAKCVKEKCGHNRYIIPKKEMIEGEEKKLYVHPYVLGAWLGAGRNTNPDFNGIVMMKNMHLLL